MNLEDVMARIQKLLNMTTDKGCTPAEAERAAMHASKLLDEYQLSMLDIQRASYSEAIGEQEWEMPGKRRPGWLNDFAASIARAYACRVVLTKCDVEVPTLFRHTITVKVVSLIFIGHLSDVQVCRFMFDTLSRRLLAQGRREGKVVGRRLHDLVTFTDWYVRAAGHAIARRIRASRSETHMPAAHALVEIKDKAVERWLDAKYGKIPAIPSSKAAKEDEADVALGYEAGRRIELQQGLEQKAKPVAALNAPGRGQ